MSIYLCSSFSFLALPENTSGYGDHAIVEEVQYNTVKNVLLPIHHGFVSRINSLSEAVELSTLLDTPLRLSAEELVLTREDLCIVALRRVLLDGQEIPPEKVFRWFNVRLMKTY